MMTHSVLAVVPTGPSVRGQVGVDSAGTAEDLPLPCLMQLHLT